MSAKRASHVSAQIEILESRRLLSAAPVSVTALAAATPAAVHNHPTVPNIVASFNGTYATSKGQTGQIIITLATESKTGKLTGSLNVVGLGSLGISGTVNVKGKVSLHGSVNHFTITISGSFNSVTKTLAGKFSTTSHHGNAHGTFSAAEVI